MLGWFVCPTASMLTRRKAGILLEKTLLQLSLELRQEMLFTCEKEETASEFLIHHFSKWKVPALWTQRSHVIINGALGEGPMLNCDFEKNNLQLFCC